MYKGDTAMAKKSVKKTAKKAATTAAKVGGVMLGGALILTHIAASAVGALVCAITRE